MNVLIVLANPEAKSFCHAMADAATTALKDAGHEVVRSDLFAQGFNAVAGRHDFETTANPDRFVYQEEQALAARENAFSKEIGDEQDKLRDADLVILIFPLWWGSPPAILKGWFERVLSYGFGYVDAFRFDTGLFKGRRALIGVTTGGTIERFSPDGVYGPIDTVLYPIKRLALEYMGYHVEETFAAYGAPRISDTERQDMLREFAARAVDVAQKEISYSKPQKHPLDLVPDDAWRR